ncbi:helix-turn-helix domain-containing protein [Planctobacterium marinum]|uniref:HTH araC/xylS-type domain-containing protein n=1 Tax=Planctobacterium marinum TaxID=1631968 RepID=A0AA48I7L1_9ALTE|nr:hypothetical protein MACH26_29610 [Planctobacterium marinum]
MIQQGLDIIPSANFARADITLLPPPEHLQQWVQCLWLKPPQKRSTAQRFTDKFYPDAGASISFEISTTNVRATFLHQAQVLTQSWTSEYGLLSVRLHPGAAGALLGLHIGDKSNLQLNLAESDFLHSYVAQKSQFMVLLDSLAEMDLVQGAKAVLAWLERLVTLNQVQENRLLPLLKLTSSNLLLPEQLAAQVGVSRRTLERRCKNGLGFTPLQLLSFSQIRRARQRLINTKDSLGEVALSCGYYDQAHFTNAFHKHTLETPQQYRLRKLSSDC